MSHKYRPGLRRWFHGGLLLITAEVLFIFLATSETTYTAVDKRLHFEAGRTAAVVAYFLATVLIFGRVLGVHSHRSFHQELSRIPAVTVFCLGGTYAVSFGLAVGKEWLDTFTGGGVEALDIFATLDGTVCLLIPTLGMIVMSFLLVPIDRVLLRLSVDSGGFSY